MLNFLKNIRVSINVFLDFFCELFFKKIRVYGEFLIVGKILVNDFKPGNTISEIVRFSQRISLTTQ